MAKLSNLLTPTSTNPQNISGMSPNELVGGFQNSQLMQPALGGRGREDFINRIQGINQIPPRVGQFQFQTGNPGNVTADNGQSSFSERGSSSHQGNGDANRALQEIPTSNNNVVDEQPPETQPPESRLCPGGCELYFEVNSSEFDLHVRRNHKIASGCHAYNYFVKKHSKMKISDEVVKKKKLSCSTCGTVYKDSVSLNRCLVRHKLEKPKKKDNGHSGVGTQEESSNPLERLRCDWEGCTDKKGFLNKKTLQKHMHKAHDVYKKAQEPTGENSLWSCLFCPKSFSNNSNLMRHVAQCSQKGTADNQSEGAASEVIQPVVHQPVSFHPVGEPSVAPPLVSHLAVATQDEGRNKQIEESDEQKNAPEVEDSDDCDDVSFSQSSIEGMI